ncbi:HAAS signaling domain-containing protein [Alkalicoccobacillus plakortidis]|uniref:DUF1700 domain-containing protein n=1 Tax=Alkalicoccobacillus plakortidis TaxID=444060 RepID=A0ABT0XMD0_9BACI|nr:DUF1700 domain-containing protein [Alkalicoccobacillus plakortidis]MCM2676377.1 DUF1700 domain-containing protein [Alkalicoccobacillus plakortidis]
MNKRDFLNELKKNLKYMSDEEKEDILQDYSLHYAEGASDQKSEDTISRKLGDPKEIAKELNAENAIQKVEEQKNIKSISNAVLSIMGLGVMNFMLVIASLFFILIFSPVILLFVVGVPIMLVSPVILVVMGFVNGFHTLGWPEVYEVIRLLAIGSVLAVVGYYIARAFMKLFIHLLKWNIAMVKGRGLM